MDEKRLTMLFVCEISHIGGANTAIEEIISSLSHEGHRIVVILGTDRENRDWSTAQLPHTTPIFRYKVDFRGNIRVFYSLFIGIWKTLTVVAKQYDADVVFLNYAYSAGITCLHPLYRKKTKIFLFHGDEPRIMWSMIPKPRVSRWLGWIKRGLFSGPFIFLVYVGQQLALRMCSGVVAFSEYAYREVIALGVSSPKVFRGFLGVNTKHFKLPSVSSKILKEQLGFSRKIIVILCTSRFEYRKGIDMLLSAFVLVLKDYPNAHLVLATPTDENYLTSQYHVSIIRKIYSLGLSEKVHILYNLTRFQLVPYYQMADLYVFPSRFLEAFGLVTLEAMACGTPVVCYEKAGAPAEVVKKLSSRYVFQDYTDLSLAKTILWALRRGKDGRTIKKATQIAQAFSWGRAGNAICNFTKQTQGLIV